MSYPLPFMKQRGMHQSTQAEFIFTALLLKASPKQEK
jgi:hypothetical protein